MNTVFTLKDVLYIIGLVATVIITFFTTKHGIKEYVRDKLDERQKELEDLKIRISRLESKEDLQEQVSSQIGLHMDKLIPQLQKALNSKEQANGK